MLKEKKEKKLKPPSFPWYCKDWLGDTELRMTSVATRGIWTDCLNYMWMAEEQGRLDCTIGKLAKMCCADLDEIAHFILEADEYGFCNIKLNDDKMFAKIQACHADVTLLSELSHANVTVINRRMYRAVNKRKSDRRRKRKSRKSHECHTNVTPPKVPKNTPPAFPFASAVQGLSKDKPAKQPAGPPLPGDKKAPEKAPESKHFSEQVGTHFQGIKKHCDAIRKKPIMNGYNFNPYQMVQKYTNEKKHPGAIEQVMGQINKLWDTILTDPWRFGSSILKSVNQNWNEKQAIEIHEELKTITSKELLVVTAGMLKSMD